MKERMLKELKLYFPSVYGHVIEHAEAGLDLLLVKLDDGDTILFDNMDKSIRRLPADSNCMSEEECKYEFGSRLRRLMMYKCVSQLELSEATGISQPQLSRYMAGKVMPSFYTADKIAKALKCSIDELRYSE